MAYGAHSLPGPTVDLASHMARFAQGQGRPGVIRNPLVRNVQPGANNPAAPVNVQPRVNVQPGGNDPMGTYQGNPAPVNTQPGGNDPAAVNSQNPFPSRSGGGGISGGGRGNGGGRGRGGKSHAPTPFDPEYYANVANYLFKTNNQIGGDLQAQALDRTALQGGLDQLRYAQPRAELAQMEKANQMGALYSTPYAQSIGEIGNQYATKEGSLTNTYGGKLSALAAQVAALRGSVPLYEEQQALASAQRLAAAAAKNKALGERKGGRGGRVVSRTVRSDGVGRVNSGGRRGAPRMYGTGGQRANGYPQSQF